MNRLGGVLVVIGLVAAACSDTAATTSTEPPTSSTTTAQASTTTQATTTTVAVTTTTIPVPTTVPGFVTALSEEPCSGIGEAPLFGEWEITFVAQGALYAVGSSGGEARCLLQADDSPQAWGAAGDRLLTLGGEAFDAGAVTAEGDLPLAVPARFEGASWTRPTGTSVVGIDDDNRLIKYPIDGGPPVDLSFLDRHDEVVYHPAGTHVLVVGEAANGDYGIWQATNIGTEPELLVAGVTATVSEPVVSHDGLFLYFLADHGAGSHMHEVFLAEGAVNEFDSSIAVETERPLSNLVVSPWSGDVAAAEGVCGTDLHTVIAWSDDQVLPGIESRPIGFLPDSPTRLLVAAWPVGCQADVSPDLYLVDLFQDSEPVLVVQGVNQFALPGVRSAVPEAPPPPGNFDFAQFA